MFYHTMQEWFAVAVCSSCLGIGIDRNIKPNAQLSKINSVGYQGTGCLFCLKTSELLASVWYLASRIFGSYLQKCF